MRRTRTSIPPPGRVRYEVEKEPLILNKSLLDLLLNQSNFADLWALYTFYYQTAKWQHTIAPKATVAYIAVGLKWTEDRVRKNRKKLLELGIIEDMITKDENNKITGHFVQISFDPPSPLNQTVGSPEGKCFNNNNKITMLDSVQNRTESSNGLITPSKFDHFWNLYPKKVDKGKALSAWNKLCRKPERPPWKALKTAIINQLKTERWKDTQFIPHPTTWLNQSRWLDDPGEMKKSRMNEEKPSYVIEDGVKWFLDKDGDYYNIQGQRLL